MKKREEVPLMDRWNIESLYPNKESWEKDFESTCESKTSPFWPSIHALQGSLEKGAKNLLNTLKITLEIDRKLSKLYTYAHLRHDENISNPEFKTCYEKISMLCHAFSQETAWFQPELLHLPENLLNEYLNSPVLKDYKFYLEKIIRQKNHTLSKENEVLMAFAGQALQTSYKAFNCLNDADLKFPDVLDGAGKLRPLSHGTYAIYLRDQDRTLRKNAFQAYHKQFSAYENTLCELINGQMQNHFFQSRTRNYPSSLDAALFPKNIETSVYHALVQAVHERLGVLHRYMKLRKKILKLDELHLYDMYTPLINSVDIHMSYEEAENLVIESVAPLGLEYQNILRQGLKTDRWVDRFENENKRSGAYSSGCFDSMPYILMNYKNIIRDVFTLAHEAGHSMHSYYSRHHQPYQYSDYSIFLAEVASTFNEDLLTRLLLKQRSNPLEKIFLINQKIEDIRATLFRQTMFAEFELKIHQLTENGVPLTPLLLKEEYKKLNHLYFGPDTIIDDEIAIEWARIPHFYYNFYVFQYATGISAALSLTEKVVNGTEQDRENYLSFLKGGSSLYPIEMLKLAGIDMTTPEPVIAAINVFDRLVTELETLLNSI